LAGATVVNLAFSRFVVEENAIAIGKFLQTSANSNLASVLVLKSLDIHPNLARNRGNLFRIDPDESRPAGATVAAPAAFEFQAFGIPGFGFGHRKTRNEIFSRNY
jgi:hypothetical protein